jgi:hypothetical protein
VPVRGLGDCADRVANVLTSWELRHEDDRPRLVTATSTSKLKSMRTVKHAIQENDVVVLRERVGDWLAGTKGTAISVYDDAALVEVSEDVPPGKALDTFVVPAVQLEIRPRSRSSSRDGMEASLMEASVAAIAPPNDLQLSRKARIHGQNRRLIVS